jgi:hypothetical protein
MDNQTAFNYAMPLGGKAVPGKILIDYRNGNAEWFQLGGLRPTFKSSKDTGGIGKWGWTPADSNSINDLRGSLPVGLTYTSDDALLKDFYTGNSIAGLNNQRAAAFNNNAPIPGRAFGVPGVRNSSGAQQPPKPTDPAPPAPGSPTPATPAAPDGGPTSTPTNTGAKPSVPQDTANTSMIAVYPLKMGSTKQDRIKFTALEYQASGNLSTGNIEARDRTSSLKGRKPLGHIFLPIQASITDANSVDWQGAGLNELERRFANLSGALMTQSDKAGIENVLGGFSETGADLIKKYQNEARVYFAQEAVGIQNLLGRFGSVLNPNLELLFSGPQLRPFEFRFQMSAREKEEATNIKNIINFFKKNMAPRTVEGNIFLRAPNTFLIEYKYSGPDQEHKGINKIKECALLNCSVDYTPLGTYMTYDDGTMVSYAMTLSFQELEPIYDKDYKDGHSIGY